MIIDNREFIMVNRKQFETFLKCFKEKLKYKAERNGEWTQRNYFLGEILVAILDYSPASAHYIAKDFIELHNYDLNIDLALSKKQKVKALRILKKYISIVLKENNNTFYLEVNGDKKVISKEEYDLLYRMLYSEVKV